MFTGIIASVGTVTELVRSGSQARLTITPKQDFTPYQLGESIAVNGVCLTVETAKGPAFVAYASAKTLEVTTLGLLSRGSLVNLERALALGDRLGGHLVSGHVDTVAQVTGITQAGESHVVRIAFDPAVAAEVVPKGSVALDGVSLTVNDCGADFLEVNVIPATWQETTIAHWRVGTKVNLETDLIGKYVARMLAPWRASTAPRASTITEDFLRQHGF
ncbi:MAG TPA: riboflavin synthase [Desulfomicrobiaceae bacterium]|jgi:riboflavin synthase|nr:riboflavin synthase [Desulfomicrobiaceae bacterium]HCF05127.1 riboflavin synthase [Desulfomicrobiaceae bacterium]